MFWIVSVWIRSGVIDSWMLWASVGRVRQIWMGIGNVTKTRDLYVFICPDWLLGWGSECCLYRASLFHLSYAALELLSRDFVALMLLLRCISHQSGFRFNIEPLVSLTPRYLSHGEWNMPKAAGEGGGGGGLFYYLQVLLCYDYGHGYYHDYNWRRWDL